MKAIKVNKANFSVDQFIGGQFAIVDNTNQRIVFGGDSANEDDYNQEYINDVFNNWNGELNSDYKIED
jgi:hypothetical protein